MDNKLVISKILNHKLGFQFRDNVLLNIQDFESKSLVDNIYVGYVKDVVKNLNAVFVEFGRDKKGFLSLKDYPGVVKEGDKMLVQVRSDKVKTKDYLLRWKLNIPKECLILTVGDSSVNVSRKIKDKETREHLKEILSDYVTEEYGFIVRTDALKYTDEDIFIIADTLIDKFAALKLKQLHSTPKTLVYKKHNTIEKCREFLKKTDGVIITDIPEIYDKLQSRDIEVAFNDDSKVNLINKYALKKNLDDALARKVWLKSGAYLIIEHTEAMTVIDVNTGKADLKTDRENTIIRINDEAAREIARHLRLRNISGTIIVDFINMKKLSYEPLLENMREYLSVDAVTTIAVDVTELGLMEITRKKQEKPLRDFF